MVLNYHKKGDSKLFLEIKRVVVSLQMTNNYTETSVVVVKEAESIRYIQMVYVDFMNIHSYGVH